MKRDYDANVYLHYDDWYDFPKDVILPSVADYHEAYAQFYGLAALQNGYFWGFVVMTLVPLVLWWVLFKTLISGRVEYLDGEVMSPYVKMFGSFVFGLWLYVALRIGPVGFYILHYFGPEAFHNWFGWVGTILMLGMNLLL